MAVTIEGFTFNRLTAQPYGYDETDTSKGLTAKRWLIQGLMTPAEWLSLNSVYDNWRDARVDDDPSEVSGVVGTTVTVTVDGPTATWSNQECWFTEAPQAEQRGYWLSVSTSVVHAAQALQVILRQEEIQEETGDEDIDFGTVDVGGTILTLKRPMESYGEGPALEYTANGSHYITGPKVVYKIRDIEGATNAAGWAAILAWYESQIITTPAVNAWFPISIPTVEAENKVVSGVTTVEYVVSIQLGQVR